MRTHSAQDDKVFSSRGQSTWFRVWMRDASGTFQQLTSLYNVNFVDELEFHESLDQPAATLTLKVRREVAKLSLAPDVAGSRINKLGGGPVFVDYNREVYVEAQIRPLGLPPDSSAWKQIFYGAVEDFDFGADPATITCRDLVMRLQAQNYIKTERAYGIWQANRRLISGTVVVATADNPSAPNAYWQLQSTITTAATEPTWPTSPALGTLVSDGTNSNVWKAVSGPTGTPMETQIQQLLDDNTGVGAWTLYTPSSPSFVTRDYNQSKEPLWTAIRRAADLKGWDLRMVWDDGTSQFRLKLYDPGRNLSNPVYTIAPSKYLPIPKWARDFQALRNDVEISYYDRSTLDNNGNPTKTSLTVTDSTSIGKYGDLYMGIAEGASSMIDTVSEASAMATAVLNDLSQAPLVATVQMDFTWWLQLNDQVTVKADGLRADSDQVLAIFSQTHRISSTGAAITELGLRSKPSSGFKRWWSKSALPGLNGGTIKATNLRAPVGVSTTPAINGVIVKFQPPSQKEMKGYDHTQLFVSTTPGFTPSSANRVHTSKSGRFDLGPGTVGASGALTPGTTYRGRLAHCDVRGNLSPFSPEFTFTPGYADLAHLNPNIAQNFLAYINNSYHVLATVGVTSDTVFACQAVSYDLAPPNTLYDNVNYNWTMAFSGKVNIKAEVQLTGFTVGDSAALILQKWNGSAFADWSIGKTYDVSTGLGFDVFEPVFSRTIPVTAGDKFQMIIRTYALTAPPIGHYTATPLLPGVGGFPGSYVQCEQQLA